MVRLILSSALTLIFLAPLLTTSALAAPTPPPRAAPTTRAVPPRTAPAPRLDWHARLAIAITRFQAEAPELLATIESLAPNRSPLDGLVFTQPVLSDPRAAPILLRRLLGGADPARVRAALVDALPLTGGDWQEAAAALVKLESSALVRKQLVEIMRHAGVHGVAGLRHAFNDEDPEVNIAAARIAGFNAHGAELFPELYARTFDPDPELRAAAIQALGMLKLPRSRDLLIKALDDESRDVRLQALLALEQLDLAGLLALPQLELLARDPKSHRIARKATQLLRQRQIAPSTGPAPPALAPDSALLPVPGAR